MIINEVKHALVGALQLNADTENWDRETPLLGHVPELDSMAVVAVLTNIEEEFDIEIEDDEISAEIFADLGSLTDFVAGKVNGQ